MKYTNNISYMYEGCSKSFEPLQEAVELGPSYSLRIFSHLYDED